MLDERQEGRENIYINVRFLDLLTSDRNDFKVCLMRAVAAHD